MLLKSRISLLTSSASFFPASAVIRTCDLPITSRLFQSPDHKQPRLALAVSHRTCGCYKPRHSVSKRIDCNNMRQLLVERSRTATCSKHFLNLRFNFFRIRGIICLGGIQPDALVLHSFQLGVRLQTRGQKWRFSERPLQWCRSRLLCTHLISLNHKVWLRTGIKHPIPANWDTAESTYLPKWTSDIEHGH